MALSPLEVYKDIPVHRQVFSSLYFSAHINEMTRKQSSKTFYICTSVQVVQGMLAAVAQRASLLPSFAEGDPSSYSTQSLSTCSPTQSAYNDALANLSLNTAS